jgi:cell wall-associated NlpC family hydrolase
MERGAGLVATLLTTALMAACASTGHTPRPFPTPGGTAVKPRTPVPRPPPTVPPVGGSPQAPAEPLGAGDGYAIAGSALSFRGVPYRNGGSDPSAGFDCSGLVQYVFAQYGVTLPREVREIYREGKSVDRSRLEPGDLVFFSTTAPGASHVGIALGGDQFVHAPSSSGVVRVEEIGSEYWARRFVGARRLDN